MSLERWDMNKNPNIGLYILVTNKYILIPENIHNGLKKALSRVLRAPLQENITIGGTNLLAVLAVGNDSGIVVSSLASEEEIATLNKNEFIPRVARTREKYFALGNVVLANDHTAILSPIVNKETAFLIEDTLDVEIFQTRVAGSELCGSIAYTTNKGTLLSPLTKEDELYKIREWMQVDKANIGTINRGNQFISSGLIANSNGGICGRETTGIELVRITKTLF
ncbi:MAG: translation initiation factor IF-6 [Promethearchaeota archaeon]